MLVLFNFEKKKFSASAKFELILHVKARYYVEGLLSVSMMHGRGALSHICTQLSCALKARPVKLVQ